MHKALAGATRPRAFDETGPTSVGALAAHVDALRRQKAIVLDALDRGKAIAISSQRISPQLAFEREWEETDSGKRSSSWRARKRDFSSERAAFQTMLHRLFPGGSDRAADRWRQDYRIASVEDRELDQVNRAMPQLGGDLFNSAWKPLR